EVADAIYDKSLVAGVGSVVLGEVETDQQIAAKTDAFPTYKHDQQVGRKYQQQHEKHEDVEIAEKAIVATFMRHVANRIDMDQQTNASNDEKHHGCEAIHEKIKADLQESALYPGKVVL